MEKEDKTKNQHEKNKLSFESTYMLQNVLHPVGYLLPAGPPQPLQDKTQN